MPRKLWAIQALSKSARTFKDIDTLSPNQGTIPSGHYVSIKIKDTGSGISEENLEKIFDPFFTTKNIGEGTGLGLSIVHGLVKQLHAHIHVNSQLNVGTEVTLLLPLIKDKSHAK